jgi:hypothetical protein
MVEKKRISRYVWWAAFAPRRTARHLTVGTLVAVRPPLADCCRHPGRGDRDLAFDRSPFRRRQTGAGRAVAASARRGGRPSRSGARIPRARAGDAAPPGGSIRAGACARRVHTAGRCDAAREAPCSPRSSDARSGGSAEHGSSRAEGLGAGPGDADHDAGVLGGSQGRCQGEEPCARAAEGQGEEPCAWTTEGEGEKHCARPAKGQMARTRPRGQAGHCAPGPEPRAWQGLGAPQGRRAEQGPREREGRGAGQSTRALGQAPPGTAARSSQEGCSHGSAGCCSNARQRERRR